MNQRGELVGLDLVRFAAAFLVMWFHLAYWADRESSLGQFAWFGWVGVPIFFVLSGFVIANSAEGSTPRRFFRSRFLRLVPAAWICATISAGVLMWVGAYSTRELTLRWLASISFWPFEPWVDGVYWTLGVEIVFYSIVWLVLALQAYQNLPLVLKVIGLSSAAYWVFRVSTGMGGPDRLVELSLLRHGIYFAIGGLLWARRGKWVIVVCVIAAMGEISSIAIPRAEMVGASPVIPPLIWLGSLGCICLSVRFPKPFINPRFARTVGLATYPLYLIHNVVGKYLLPFGLITAMAASVLSSVAIALYAEPWIRRKFEPALGKGLAPALRPDTPAQRSGPPTSG